MTSPTAHDIDKVLNDAIRAAPDLGALTRLEDAAWLIEAAHGQGILAEWVADRPKLVLTAELGHASPEHELFAYKTALVYNGLWRRNGALRLARDEDGALLMLTDLHEADLELPALVNGLVHFGAVQALWTAALDGLAQGRVDPAPPDLSPGLRI